MNEPFLWRGESHFRFNGNGLGWRFFLFTCNDRECGGRFIFRKHFSSLKMGGDKKWK